MKILLIEDDEQIRKFTMKGLSQEGFVVDSAETGDDGFFKASTEEYDLLIVDVMLPGMDGFTIVEKLRTSGSDTPVLFLSAKDSVADRVTGLQKGGDDYLTKPFAFSELVARVQALIRRSTAQQDPTTLTLSDLEIDLIRRKVSRGGVAIELQPLEYNLLAYFMRHPGRVISKTMIMEHVWDYNFDPQTNVVEARICKLRDKIDRPFKTNLIHTIRGFGYVLEEKQ